MHSAEASLFAGCTPRERKSYPLELARSPTQLHGSGPWTQAIIVHAESTRFGPYCCSDLLTCPTASVFTRTAHYGDKCGQFRDTRQLSDRSIALIGARSLGSALALQLVIALQAGCIYSAHVASAKTPEGWCFMHCQSSYSHNIVPSQSVAQQTLLQEPFTTRQCWPG